MSKNIVDDHLFTPEEVAYLEARNRYREIEINRAEFGPGGRRENEKPEEADDEGDVLELDRDIYEYVVGLDLKKTQAALRKAGIKPVGGEHELKTILAQYLQGTRDADTDS